MRAIPQNMAPNPEAGARIMALDLGEKRIGVALSDMTRTIASSFAVLNRSSRLADFEKISQIIDEQGVKLLIVGMPTLLSGEEGSKAAWVRDYAADLARRIEIEVQFWDESFSTIDAAAAMRAQGQKGRKQRKRIDAVAAAVILQSYLDEQRPGVGE